MIIAFDDEAPSEQVRDEPFELLIIVVVEFFGLYNINLCKRKCLNIFSTLQYIMSGRKLIDRTKELDQLEDIHKKDGLRFVIITGRRRIGKSRLIKEFIKDKNHLRVQFEKRNQSYNLKRMNQAISNSENIPNPNFSSFSDAFEYLAKTEKKTIIILDEFSYLIKYSDALAEFQTIIDEILTDSEIMLVTLGSSFSIMKRGLLEYSSPLYGRSEGLINVQPLRLIDLFQWFPHISTEDIIRIHGVCGGVPRYLELFNGQNDIKKGIEKLFFDPNSFLFHEARELLEEEFDDPVTYYSVLEAVSMGNTRVSDIGHHAFLEPKNTAKYLNILTKLGILRHEFSYGMNRKRGIYRFKDHYFAFWFKFISMYFEDIESGFNQEAITRFRSEFETYLGHHFENAMHELTPGLMSFDTLSFGRWWYKGKEIDLILEGKRDICFVEYKWQKLSIRKAEKIINDLISRSDSFKPHKKKNHYLLLGREIENKSEIEDSNILVKDLKDL
jgi:AAA+ ATPase superfamily predicted ATPase